MISRTKFADLVISMIMFRETKTRWTNSLRYRCGFITKLHMYNMTHESESSVLLCKEDINTKVLERTIT